MKLKHGVKVEHKKHGAGMVFGEWGPILVEHGDHETFYNCAGVFDVIFKRSSGEPFIHSCRAQYLERPEGRE